MTKARLVSLIAASVGITKRDAAAVLEELGQRVIAATARGERVALPGFGVWTRRKRKARRILDPSTRQPMQLPVSWTIGFRACRNAKAAVSEKAQRKRKPPPPVELDADPAELQRQVEALVHGGAL
jgi:DNA-binding protein HU-beta